MKIQAHFLRYKFRTQACSAQNVKCNLRFPVRLKVTLSKLKKSAGIILLSLGTSLTLAPASAEALAPGIMCHQAPRLSLLSLKVQESHQTRVAEFAKLLNLDAETQKALENPMVFAYTYLRIFEKEMTPDQINYYLTKIRDSGDIQDINLYEIVQQKILSQMEDPTVKERLEAVFGPAEVAGPLKTKWARIRQTFKQMAAFPRTLLKMRSLSKKHYSTAVMDRGLFDFYGAVKLDLKESKLRQWEGVEGSFGAIRLSDIEDISPEYWARGALFSSEVEGGIKDYSEQSGEMFRGYLPSLAYFMGRNKEEAAKVKGKADYFCINTWCREEKRHEGALRTVYRQLFGINPPPKNPSEAYHELNPFELDDVLYHLYSRNATEWNANSGYLFMMAHSKGASHAHVNNIRADETKHISIFSSAFKYVFGLDVGFRFKMMIKKIYEEYKYEKAARSSDGNILNDSPFSMFEIVMSHIFVETRVREYTKTVPLRTLRKIFEAEPHQADNLQETTPEKTAAILEMRKVQKAQREELSRWSPQQKEQALKQEAFEKENDAIIRSAIEELGNFKGSEIAGSTEGQSTIKNIQSLAKKLSQTAGVDRKLLETSLLENLRDYQIIANEVAVQNGYTAVLVNSWTGFELVKDTEAKAESLN